MQAGPGGMDIPQERQPGVVGAELVGVDARALVILAGGGPVGQGREGGEGDAHRYCVPFGCRVEVGANP